MIVLALYPPIIWNRNQEKKGTKLYGWSKSYNSDLYIRYFTILNTKYQITEYFKGLSNFCKLNCQYM